MLTAYKVVPGCLLIVVAVAFLLRATDLPNHDMAQTPLKLPKEQHESNRQAHHLKFSAPTKYFLPSLADTNPATFDPITTNFGLISQSYDSDTNILDPKRPEISPPLTDWQRFTHHISILNSNSSSSTAYHVLYLARHGQGYHNLAESYYGSQAWDCYWAELDGDTKSSITWADAHLSLLGQQQARTQSHFWRSQINDQKMPAPQAWYVSPMDRACKTLEITFLPLQEEGTVQGWKPTVKEFLRETNGIHTCDRRSPKSVIAERYPKYEIEETFTEEDELWDPVHRETDDAHAYRAALALDDIFSSSTVSGTDKEGKSEKGRFISITAHGGMINAILRAISHRSFQVQVGSAIAVIVKTEKLEGTRPPVHFKEGPTKPDCVGDPLKVGLPGYKSFRDYVDEVEKGVTIPA